MCRESAREEPEYLCRHSVDHDDYLKSALFSEIQILQLLKSDNVVKVLDVMESSHNYYIIQEICDSDLEKYMQSHPQLSEAEALGFLRQICNGFIALVREGIVHRYSSPHPATSSRPTSCSAREWLR
jgi:serine/threonine protein kinase